MTPCAIAQSPNTTPLVLNYLERHDATERSSDPLLLGRIGFGTQGADHAEYSVPSIHISLPTVGDSLPYEVWKGRNTAHYGVYEGIQYAENGEVLFGCITALSKPLEVSTYESYRDLIHLMRSIGYPHLIRAWNYFPRINEAENRLERYKLFCMGRHRAFEEAKFSFSQELPAASAIGTETGALCIYFIAARDQGKPIENTRQISAYRYPKRYGPRSPSFSRAMLLCEQSLFISGTASIKGHESLHANDITMQCEETLKNLKNILQQAKAERISYPAVWKVYLRQHDQHALIYKALLSFLADKDQLMILKGDICRKNLLIEIEGVLSL